MLIVFLWKQHSMFSIPWIGLNLKMFKCKQGKPSNYVTSLKSRNFSLWSILCIYCRINIKCFLSTRNHYDGHLGICLEGIAKTTNILHLIYFTFTLHFSLIILCVSTSCLSQYMTLPWRQDLGIILACYSQNHLHP